MYVGGSPFPDDVNIVLSTVFLGYISAEIISVYALLAYLRMRGLIVDSKAHVNIKKFITFRTKGDDKKGGTAYKIGKSGKVVRTPYIGGTIAIWSVTLSTCSLLIWMIYDADKQGIEGSINNIFQLFILSSCLFIAIRLYILREKYKIV